MGRPAVSVMCWSPTSRCGPLTLPIFMGGPPKFGWVAICGPARH